MPPNMLDQGNFELNSFHKIQLDFVANSEYFRVINITKMIG